MPAWSLMLFAPPAVMVPWLPHVPRWWVLIKTPLARWQVRDWPILKADRNSRSKPSTLLTPPESGPKNPNLWQTRMLALKYSLLRVFTLSCRVIVSRLPAVFSRRPKNQCFSLSRGSATGLLVRPIPRIPRIASVLWQRVRILTMCWSRRIS